jgi:hypothetical protein
MTAKPVYESRPLKRPRRNKAELNAILQGSLSIIAEETATDENAKITIRHLFYRLVSESLLNKTQRDYKNLIKYLMKWRRGGKLPWAAFADNTRWYYGNVGYISIESALINTRDTYRRNLWSTQDAFVEIWTEKDAIASILLQESYSFGVQVFPVRGFSSGTALYNAADHFKAQQAAGKEVYIYYFGDHDPSGVEIDNSAMRNLKNDHGVDVNFQRLAVTPEHIKTYNLPTRPTKKTDSRSKNFLGESVEIDAMPMQVLRGLVRECIIQHIDPSQWEMQKRIEAQERGLLTDVVRQLGEVLH